MRQSTYKVSIALQAITGGEEHEFDEPHLSLFLQISSEEGPDGRHYALRGRGNPATGWPRDTVTRWQAELQPEEEVRLSRLLAGLEIRDTTPRPLGCDGAWFILEIHGQANNLTLQWWCEVPPEWQSAGALFDYVMEVAERAFARVSAQA